MTEPLETFIRVSSGQHVRLRLMGQGPALLMCHESPRSSVALLPLANKLKDRFTCILMDTPGFGLSDPMTVSRPEIEDFATVALDVIRCLELGSIPVYGTHTGAAIAVEAAVQAPDLVSAAILDGFALFNAQERDELLASYLPKFEPSLDGGHVAWLWARVRDQFAAFPWNRVGDGSRLQFGPPPLDFVQSVAQDFLLSGDSYRIGYAAAFRYDHLAALSRTEVPIQIITREDDLLFEHMKRASGSGDHVTLNAISPDRAFWAQKISDIAAEYVGEEALGAATLAARAVQHEGEKRFVNTDVGPVCARVEGNGPVVALLHDVPGGLTDLDHLAERLSETHKVVRIDLPGSGNASLSDGKARTLETLVQGTSQALAALDAADAPILASGASLAVAAALPGSRRIIALDPWPVLAEAAGDHVPDLAPKWDGTHLHAAFWWARDYEIYKPWYHLLNLEGRNVGNERDAARIEQRFRAVVAAGPSGAELARILYHACAGIAATGLDHVLLYDTDPDAAALAERFSADPGREKITAVSRENPALARAVQAVLG